MIKLHETPSDIARVCLCGNTIAYDDGKGSESVTYGRDKCFECWLQSLSLTNLMLFYVNEPKRKGAKPYPETGPPWVKFLPGGLPSLGKRA